MRDQPPTRCPCGQEIYRLTNLIRSRNDLCERCRIAAGLPAPQLPGTSGTYEDSSIQT